jgi:hypothetical protein
MSPEIPESGNAAAKAGKLGTTIQSILVDLKSEAVYFTDSNGQGTAFNFLDMVRRFSNSSHRAVVSCVQRQRKDSPGHDKQ